MFDIDLVGVFFGESLTTYLTSVVFVVFVVAALRFSRALPNSTWVRIATVLLALSASVRFLGLESLSEVTWSPAFISDLIHQTFIIWALCAIIVEVALDEIQNQLRNRVTSLLGRVKSASKQGIG